MKTTIDLPDRLVRELKLRAAHEGRKIKDVVAGLLLSGMAAEAARAEPSPPIKGAIRLPLFDCGPDAPARHMTMEQITALEQETQTAEDLERLGLPV